MLFGSAAALHQAHASGILARLCNEGSQTAEAPAASLGLDARAIAVVLRLLSVRAWLADADFPAVERIALEGSFSAVGALFARRHL